MLPPDLILHGGKIITLDRASRSAQAISVRSGHIAAVGYDAALLEDAAPTTRLIDLNGRSVLPGFFDAHPHADREGLKARGGIPIAGLHSVADIVEVVKQAAQTTPAGEWIVLMPMGEPPHEYINRPDQLTDGRFPTRHDLDAAAPDHAVYIRAVWGWWSRRPFPSVANSLALMRAGVTRDTTAPHNVEILKDSRGEPTGVFLERNFVPVLEYTLFRDLPRFKYCDRVESVRLGAHAYVAAGTTSLYEGHGLTPTVIRAYRENAERDAMPLRMHAPVSMPSAAFDDKRLIDLFYHYAGPAGGRGRGDDILRVEGINLGGHADATVADIIAAGYPYDQWAGHFYQAMTAERFVKLGIEAARLGLRVNCVISRDIEYGLSAYEAIDKEVSICERRWVMIHVNQATDAQIRRMKALGVIATVVPGFLWMAGDRYGLDKLGSEGIPIRRLLDGGVPVALSTDGVPYSMLWAAWEAITRWDEDGQRHLGESYLTREEALRMAAQSGHRLTWNEDRFGSLEVGKVADMAVLAEDPLTCDLDHLKDIRIERTFVGGRQVYGPAAKAATQTIPIVFSLGSNPVEVGLVQSLNHPGGNVTGHTALQTTVTAKRLELLHELMPAVTKIAFLVNSANRALAESDVKEARDAAHALGVNLLILNASSPSEIDAAFAILIREQAGALLTNSESLFMVHSDHLAALTARHQVPALYAYRENVMAGGLMSYGANFLNGCRELGLYTGRVLKGEKPGDLPVQQATKIELVINLKTAKALGIAVSPSLLTLADELIE